MLYELLAGRRPFTADLPEAMMMQHLYDQPTPLRSLRPEVPAELETLVSELMAKDKRDRPANANEVLSVLAAIRADAEQGESRRLTAYEPRPEPESGRATVYAPDLHSESRTSTASESDLAPESARVTVLADDGAASPVGLLPVGSVAAARSDPAAAPVRFGPGLSGGSAPPAMPNWGKPAKPRRRPRRWLSVLSTFLTLAIIAAVGVVLWLRTHEVFKVTSVAVAPAALPGNKCNVTVDVVGSIVTNGRGGQVTYQWVRNGDIASPVATTVVGTGQTTAPLHLDWYLHRQGHLPGDGRTTGAEPASRNSQDDFHVLLPLRKAV